MSHFPSILTTCCALTILSATGIAQSITGSAQALTNITVEAFDVTDPVQPPATGLLAALTPLPDGTLVSAAVSGGPSFAVTRFTLQQNPVVYRVEETTTSQPLGDNTDGYARTGSHDTWLILQVTRDYSGDVVVRWNGIEQNDGSGSLSCAVDIGADNTFEFNGSDGETAEVRFPVSFTPALPLRVKTRTSAESLGTEFSAYKSILEIEFEPDENTVAPGQWSPFGFGCAGTNGFAPLLLAGANQPLVGEAFTTEVLFVPPSNTGIFGLLAFDSIPALHLDILGMPFCFLFLNPLIALPIQDPVVGDPTWDLPIPNATNFVGGTIAQQVLVFDPGANPFGAVLSNPGEGTIGGQ